MARFSLSDIPVDTATLRANLLDDRVGAYVGFEGWVRDHNEGRPVTGLRYEAYAALATSEATGYSTRRPAATTSSTCIASTASATSRSASWRCGSGVTAAHRDAAFAACRFVIDEVKARVPIWKHEAYVEGDAGWLHPRPAEPPPPV